MAITRNASESLENLQYGIDLKRGDEVICCDQDYPRMITTFQQRERREGIVLKTFSIPAPCRDNAQVVAAYEAHMTERTRLVLVSHVIFMTGAIQPVREIVAAAVAARDPRDRGRSACVRPHPLPVRDLGCDNYSSSLHKWLAAPIGTGLLYLKRDRIKDVWPLMAASPEQDANIRKFEEIGTHPAANTLAIAEALAFHAGMGGERKLARLVYLRDRWAKRLARERPREIPHQPRARILRGVRHVRDRRDQARPISRPTCSRSIASSPSGITPPAVRRDSASRPTSTRRSAEIDRFADAVESVLAHGLEKA